MRTIAYIDGFNFYYGAVAQTRFKWLDFRHLLKRALPPQCNVIRIKYFSARLSSLPHNPGADVRQRVYFEALKTHIPEMEILLGHFLTHKKKMYLADHRDVTLLGTDTVFVINTEEKGSDVNLAVTLVNDAWVNSMDCGVIISNDSDLTEAFRIAHVERQKDLILLTPPRFKNKRSKQLKKYSCLAITLKTELLQSSQLPDPIPGTGLRRPLSW